MANNSVLSPDAALLALDCWQALTAEQCCGGVLEEIRAG
jgi:hypothetical protein